jgi:N-acetylglucosamine kinase-like BadF-type ATPase
LLTRCGGELKTALVAHESNLEPEAARARLWDAGGRVGEALKALRPQPVGTTDSGLVLGIDGGGSHTVALLTTVGGEVLGRGESGPSNLQAVGVAKALQALDDAIAGAFTAARRPRGPVAGACFGLAGADRDQEKKLISDWAERNNVAPTVEVTGDAQLLLAAGTPDGWGVGVVAGTGSIAVGRAPDGRFARSGGWGYLLGDEGSGYALVVDALKAIARATDGLTPPTSLTDRLLAAMNLTRPIDLIPAVYRGGWDRTALASLAPHVMQSAAEGDAAALGVVADGAAWLARNILRVIQALGLEPTGVPLALTGGTLLGSDLYRDQLLAALEGVGVRADPVALVKEPAVGAARLAGVACQASR